MFLFKQYLTTTKPDIACVQVYNYVCEFLKVTRKIIFTDRCELFMRANAIFHTSYISQVHSPSYIIATNIQDVNILQSISHNHKIIMISNEKINDDNIITIDNNQDLTSIAYEIQEAIEQC